MAESSNRNGAGAGGRLTGTEAAELSRQIASLTGAGLPLAGGLVALGEELPRGRLRRSMFDLAHMLESGVSLEQAVSAEHDKIPPHLRGLVVAGARSGELGAILSRFMQYASIGAEIKRALWLSLAFPILTVTAAGSVFLLVCTVLVGQFEAVYRDFNLALPRLTIALLYFSRVLGSVWPPLAIIGGLIFVAWLLAHTFLTPPVRRSLAGRLPLLGTVWRSTSLAEFCHLLALLLESRLPLPAAVRLTGEGVQDADIENSCNQIASQIEAGRSIAAAMEKFRPFPAGLARLLRWAESQRSLPEVLHLAGGMFEARARSHATFVGAVLNVLCMLLVLSMLVVVPGLFAPLITLISRLAG
jgi:general secretion pathway protein F